MSSSRDLWEHLLSDHLWDRLPWGGTLLWDGLSGMSCCGIPVPQRCGEVFSLLRMGTCLVITRFTSWSSSEKDGDHEGNQTVCLGVCYPHSPSLALADAPELHIAVWHVFLEKLVSLFKTTVAIVCLAADT